MNEVDEPQPIELLLARLQDGTCLLKCVLPSATRNAGFWWRIRYPNGKLRRFDERREAVRALIAQAKGEAFVLRSRR